MKKSKSPEFRILQSTELCKQNVLVMQNGSLQSVIQFYIIIFLSVTYISMLWFVNVKPILDTWKLTSKVAYTENTIHTKLLLKRNSCQNAT